MLIVWFLSIKSLPNLLFGVLCLPGDQSHLFAQPTINPLACCICWAGLLGRAVFPPWNEGPNSGSYNKRTSLVAQLVKNLPTMWETWVRSLSWEDPLEEEGIATHSSVLAWRIPMDRGVWWGTVHGVAKSQT